MKVLCPEQYTPEYWQHRRGVPSASNADRIITPKTAKPSSGMDGYIDELLGDMFDPGYAQHLDHATAAMRNGSIMEPEARHHYAAFGSDEEVQETGFVTTDDDRFGCSPDALVGDNGGLELKCPIHKTHVEYLRSGTLPDKYKPQVHWSLIVTGRSWWDFMSYARNLPVMCVRVEPDEFTTKLRDCMEAFWTRYQDRLKSLVDAGAILPKTPKIKPIPEPDEVIF